MVRESKGILMREMETIRIAKNETSWDEKYTIWNETQANGINSRLYLAEENINKPEGRAIETRQIERQRKKA